MSQGNQQSFCSETITEFFEQCDELLDIISKTLIELKPGEVCSHQLIDEIFRGVHTFKGNLIILGLKEIGEFVHRLENFLAMARSGEIFLNEDTTQLVHLMLEEAKINADNQLQGEEWLDDFQTISQLAITLSNPVEEIRLQAIDSIFRILEPYRIDASATLNLEVHPQNNLLYKEQDLDFFDNLSFVIEKRIGSSAERLKLVKEICSKINEKENFPVEEEQLNVAILLYGWGLATLPLTLLEKNDSLNNEQLELIHQYPSRSAAMLEHMPDWRQAREIMVQCRERPDGQGYPSGLPDNEISDGAKILSIADSFAAMIHVRPFRTFNARTLMKAILEINKYSGTQFNEYYVEVFNHVIKEIHVEQKVNNRYGSV